MKKTFKDENDLLTSFKGYIDYCHENERLPNVAGFCVYLGINRDTFYAQQDYYSDTYKVIHECLEDEALNCKAFKDNRIIFYMKNKCGYKDKQEIEQTSDDKITIVNDLDDVE